LNNKIKSLFIFILLTSSTHIVKAMHRSAPPPPLDDFAMTYIFGPDSDVPPVRVLPDAPSETHNSGYQEKYETPTEEAITGKKRKREELEITRYPFLCQVCGHRAAQEALFLQHIREEHDENFEIDPLETKRKKPKPNHSIRHKKKFIIQEDEADSDEYISSDKKIIHKKSKRKPRKRRAKRLTS